MDQSTLARLDALSRVSVRTRDILIYLYEGKSQREIARLCRCTAARVSQVKLQVAPTIGESFSRDRRGRKPKSAA